MLKDIFDTPEIYNTGLVFAACLCGDSRAARYEILVKSRVFSGHAYRPVHACDLLEPHKCARSPSIPYCHVILEIFKVFFLLLSSCFSHDSSPHAAARLNN